VSCPLKCPSNAPCAPGARARPGRASKGINTAGRTAWLMRSPKHWCTWLPKLVGVPRPVSTKLAGLWHHCLVVHGRKACSEHHGALRNGGFTQPAIAHGPSIDQGIGRIEAQGLPDMGGNPGLVAGTCCLHGAGQRFRAPKQLIQGVAGCLGQGRNGANHDPDEVVADAIARKRGLACVTRSHGTRDQAARHG